MDNVCLDDNLMSDTTLILCTIVLMIHAVSKGHNLPSNNALTRKIELGIFGFRASLSKAGDQIPDAPRSSNISNVLALESFSFSMKIWNEYNSRIDEISFEYNRGHSLLYKPR